MTDDQLERLIAAVERMAASSEENLKLHREAEARMQRREEQMSSGQPPPGMRQRMEAIRREVRDARPPLDTPPEMMRMIEALEKIATGLNRNSS